MIPIPWVILLCLVSLLLGMTIIYVAFIYIDNKQSLEEVADIHTLLNQYLDLGMGKVCADKGIIYQVSNGKVFEGGNSIKEFFFTNERNNPQKKHLRKWKHKYPSVLYEQYADVITAIKNEGFLILSDNNQYETYQKSLDALKMRQMRSGVYFKISKKVFGKSKMSAIIGFEYESENPPPINFETILFTEIQDMALLINKQISLKIAIKKAKKMMLPI